MWPVLVTIDRGAAAAVAHAAAAVRISRPLARLPLVRPAARGRRPRSGTAIAGELACELDALEQRVERIAVPLSYVDELYALRSHIQLVRGRLRDWRRRTRRVSVPLPGLTRRVERRPDPAEQLRVDLARLCHAHCDLAHAARRHEPSGAASGGQVAHVQPDLDLRSRRRPEHRELLLAAQAHVALLRRGLERAPLLRWRRRSARAAGAARPWRRRRSRPAGRAQPALAALRPSRPPWASALASP